jgi:hypothetical protein
LNVFSIGDFLFLLSLRSYLNDEEYACGGSYYDNYHYHWGDKKFENNTKERSCRINVSLNSQSTVIFNLNNQP